MTAAQSKTTFMIPGNAWSAMTGESRKEMIDKKLYYLTLWKKQKTLLPTGGRLLTFQRYVRLISSLSNPSASILDIGCGPGFISHMLKLKGHGEVVGIDLVNRFQNRHNLSFLVAENTRLPFRSKSFDVVFARRFVSIRDMAESLHEFHKVLKDEGTLVIEVPNVKRLKSRIYEFLGLTPSYPHKYFPHLHRTPFREMLQLANYRVQDIEGDYVFIPLIGNLISALKLDQFQRALGKLKPNLCLHLLATCRKQSNAPTQTI